MPNIPTSKKWLPKIFWTIFVVGIFLFPFVVLGTPAAYWVRLLGIVGLYVILALGLNVSLGFAGLFDLGFMAFYAVGAYTAGILAIHGFSFWIATLGAMGAAVLLRLVVGAPVLRLRGDYLAIVTLGFGEIVRLILNNCDALTNGPKGLPRVGESIADISLFGYRLSDNIHFYLLIWAVAFLAVIVSQRLNCSRIGRAWTAVREDPVAAELTGIPVTRVKMLAFATSGLFAGIAGSLFVHWEKFITPESFTFWESVMVVSMIVLGGMGSIPGTLLGAILISGFPLFLQALLGSSWIEYRYLIFGLALAVVISVRPQGLWPSRRRALELNTEENRVESES